MFELVTDALALPGLIWVLGITVLAGIVYGFAGFGAALVFMPVATAIIPVEMAIAAFAVSALASVVTVVPGAWAVADRRAVSFMILVATAALPVGIWILRVSDVTVLRWAVLTVTTLTLLALMTGWRYETRPGWGTRGAVSVATGIVGGATGLVGPIMVLFQLGSTDSIARSRANTLVFLTMTGLLTAPMMALQGLLTQQAVVLGLLLILPYGLASLLGQRLFDPARHVLYRRVAYMIITGAIVMGLPIWE